MSKKQYNKIVLAYSGGLDTSIIVPWLKENYGCEVVCYTADVGQGNLELDGLKEKAIASGALDCVIYDLKEELAKDFIFPMVRCGAKYEHKYLLGTSIARPITSKYQIKTAHDFGAEAVAHGATGKGNDQVRFELTYMAIDPRIEVVAPWREWDILSREDAIDYAAKHNIPVPNTKKSIYSRDSNLWHISHEGGILEDPWNAPDESMFMKSVSPMDAPDEPETIVIEFEQGNAVAINDVKYSPAQLIIKLNELGGKHGIGRADLVESRLVGMKSHGVYETPGGTILMNAHEDLESIVLDKDTIHYKEIVALKYAEIVYNGLWYSPLREAIDAFVNVTQKHVTGKVALTLYKGNIINVGRQSPYSLYREDFATFGQDDVYEQMDAKGFINLFGLPLKVHALNNLPLDGLDLDQPDYSMFKRD